MGVCVAVVVEVDERPRPRLGRRALLDGKGRVEQRGGILVVCRCGISCLFFRVTAAATATANATAIASTITATTATSPGPHTSTRTSAVVISATSTTSGTPSAHSGLVARVVARQ
jgi:hypothetical protein